MVINGKKKGLGAFQFELLSTLERNKKRLFNISEVYLLFPNSSKNLVRKTLSKLVGKGRIQRVKRGSYLLVPLREEDYALNELSLVEEYFPGGYVSFLAAMRY